jgi:hypothetical protein
MKIRNPCLNCSLLVSIIFCTSHAFQHSSFVISSFQQTLCMFTDKNNVVVINYPP